MPRRPNLNRAITRLYRDLGFSTPDDPVHRPTPESAQRWWAAKRGRVPIISEDAITSAFTPEQRAQRIALMRAQLVGDLLAVLRRRV